jgi:hypothetical protein
MPDVHELADLIEPNHTPAFGGIVRAKTPTMEKAKACLKQHGPGSGRRDLIRIRRLTPALLDACW